MNFLAGCPCPDFDCSLLNELGESCLDLTENENYQFCFEEQRNLLFKCLNNCKVMDCNIECNEKFAVDIQKCSCGQKCPCECKNNILFSY